MEGIVPASVSWGEVKDIGKDSYNGDPMPIIERKELDIAAIFPQCFDNQFVSFDEFATICSKGLSYKDKQIAERRLNRTGMEINRSLVYGQQVCINRASLPNCKPLYELYLPDFGADPNPHYQIDEIGELLNTRALVPYLFQGTAIEGDGKFNLDVEGQRALNHLLETHTSKITFLTLGPTPEDVEKNAAMISMTFEERIDHLARVADIPSVFPVMLAEVLPCANLLGNQDAVSYLRKNIYILSDLAGDCTKRRRSEDTSNPKTFLTREDIYKAVLVRECKCGKGLEDKDCTCVTDGKFARLEKSHELGAQFCLKTLVDLVYAANVPDMLSRYLLTPWQLPTRNALQDYGQLKAPETTNIDDVARTTFIASQRLLAVAGQAMFLPMLEDLTLFDICRIRELRAWRDFMKAQEHLLKDPLKGAGTFEAFQEEFSNLQLAISSYWCEQQFRGSRGKKYRSFVSATFQIGKYAVQWGIRKSGLFDAGGIFIIDRVIDYIANMVEERVTVGPAKLMFEIFDSETNEVDAVRSWSVVWMSEQVAWERQELLALLREERGVPADSVIVAGASVANASMA